MQRAGNQEIAWEMAFLSRFTALRTVTSSSAEILSVYVGVLNMGCACHTALFSASGASRGSINGYSVDLISVQDSKRHLQISTVIHLCGSLEN